MSTRDFVYDTPLGTNETGIMRGCLLLAGFMPEAEGDIFNDAKSFGGPLRRIKLWAKSFGGPLRRIKLWDADSIFTAPDSQQQTLFTLINEAFGDRVAEIRFVFSADILNTYDVSLAVFLKD